MIKLLLIIFLINVVNSINLNLNENSIITFKYFNNYSKPINILINKINYRESSLIPYNKGIYSIYLKKGIYDIEFSKNITFNYFLEKGKIIRDIDYLNDIIIKNNSWNLIKSINYYSDKNKIIKISSMINFNFKFKNINYKFKIKINNQILFDEILNTSVFNFYSENIELNKNYYNITFLIFPFNNILCSCPSYKNGFFYGRHFTIFEKESENLNNQLIINNKNKKNIITEKTLNNYIIYNYITYRIIR